MIPAIIGSCIGVLGGVIGTFYSIKRAKNQIQKKQTIILALILWLIIFICIGLFFIIPNPFKVTSFIPCWISLPFLIKWARKNNVDI
jgi:hypothetical protein